MLVTILKNYPLPRPNSIPHFPTPLAGPHRWETAQGPSNNNLFIDSEQERE